MLNDEQHHQLRSLAERRGQSIGSLVRESVARYLAAIAVEDDPLSGLIGLAEDSGPRPRGDVAMEHDAYLAEKAAQGPAGGVAAPTAPSTRPTTGSARRPGRSTRATA